MIVSLLLRFALLSLVLFLGEELANLLVPFPLSLNVSGGILHVHLLLPLPLELGLALLLLLVALGLLLRFFLNKTMHALNLCLILDLLLFNGLTLLVEVLNLVLSELILLVSELLKHISLGLNKLADPITDKIFGIKLLLQGLDSLVQFLLFLIENTG